MLTTSYPHSQGMAQQGIPQGHPMGGPGGPNQGHQMHPGMGVSGPNGPVSQAGPMMGMQPGMGGPNSHAMQHLQPQQQHMFAQQQHPGMMNPAMIQQQRNAQQQAYMRQQQQQAMLQQQAGGMSMGFQNGMPNMQNMTPQQMAAVRSQMGQGGGLVNLPPHLLAQQQQQMQMQQQGNPQHQAALMQHQQQQHMQQQQQQQHAQAQAQAQANAIAMQHANSQQSNHSHNANQGPPATSQPQQGPLRPPSAMSHQGHTSPAPPQTPQQAPPPQQPPPQQPPQHSGPQPGQQTPAPAQPPSLPQQPHQQPQNPAQAQQQRNPVMAQQVQVQAQAQAQAVQAQAQQAAQARNMAMMKQAQAANVGTGGTGYLRLMNFVDQIGKYTAEPGSNNIQRWQSFVDRFFNETGAFIHCAYNQASQSTKQWEIVYAALPRYFYTLFNNTDVTNLQITLDGAAEKASPPELKVTCDRAKFIYTYQNQCQVVYTGKLTAFWSGSDKMEWLQFEGESHQQYIPRSALEALFHQPSPNQMNPNQSPRMNKNTKQKLQQQRAVEPPEPYLPISRLPMAGVGDFGLPPILINYLEIYETMNNMTSLMGHYLEHPDMNTVQALDSWNNMMSTTNPAPTGQQNPGQNPGQPGQMQQPNMPPGVRPGPGQQGNHMFMSPAMANSLLPPNGAAGSPGMMHTPSPNSHSMVKQQSTSSHTASVNTSPNMQKRRRSTAKIDLDDGEGMNGTKVKQSPRVGGGKRLKGGG